MLIDNFNKDFFVLRKLTFDDLASMGYEMEKRLKMNPFAKYSDVKVPQPATVKTLSLTRRAFFMTKYIFGFSAELTEKYKINPAEPYDTIMDLICVKSLFANVSEALLEQTLEDTVISLAADDLRQHRFIQNFALLNPNSRVKN